MVLNRLLGDNLWALGIFCLIREFYMPRPWAMLYYYFDEINLTMCFMVNTHLFFSGELRQGKGWSPSSWGQLCKHCMPKLQSPNKNSVEQNSWSMLFWLLTLHTYHHTSFWEKLGMSLCTPTGRSFIPGNSYMVSPGPCFLSFVPLLILMCPFTVINCNHE